MRSPPSLSRVVRWAVSMPYALWRYATYAIEVRERELDCEWPIEGFPGASGERARDDGLQRPDSGHGPAFHRLYRVDASDPVMTPEQIISVLAGDLNVAAPLDISHFLSRSGERREVARAEEFLVVLPGPWNGPIRVLDRGPRSFRFGTLPGHMEAGEIEFRAEPVEGGMRLSIESWARSADWLFHLLYHRTGISKAVQRHMWAQFLERAARVAGGRPGPVEVVTRRCLDPPG